VSAPSNTERDLEARIERLAYASFGTERCRIEWLEGQLGLRRFARVGLPGCEPSSAVARVDNPEDPRGRPGGVPPEPPLEPIRALLEAEGLPVPRRYGVAGEIELLEDVGTLSLRDALEGASAAERRTLYEAACDLVPALQRVQDPGGVEAFTRRLDAPLIAYKAKLFIDWSLASRGRATTPAEGDVVREAFARVARACEEAPQRLSHRDFQSANIHVQGDLTSRSVTLRLIDLQGAFLAPPEYDLVCLLRDSYVSLDPAEIRHQLARIVPALPDALDADESRHRFDLLTLTRKGKDHARSLYAAHERGDDRFLRFLASTLRGLREAAEACARRDPAYTALSELVHELPETPCAR
jgi:aminoglycoside phosphotransferase (APT) family kinase protein